MFADWSRSWTSFAWSCLGWSDSTSRASQRRWRQSSHTRRTCTRWERKSTGERRGVFRCPVRFLFLQKEREKALKLSATAGLKGKKKAKAKVPALSDDPVHNDFLREMLFYRQAQAAVVEAIPRYNLRYCNEMLVSLVHCFVCFLRLKSMGIPTKRPDDYYAQMAKTDQHMQKANSYLSLLLSNSHINWMFLFWQIREKLVSKQALAERMEKIRKLRELRKFGKKVQVEVQLKRQKEKREMLEQVCKDWCFVTWALLYLYYSFFRWKSSARARRTPSTVHSTNYFHFLFIIIWQFVMC